MGTKYPMPCKKPILIPTFISTWKTDNTGTSDEDQVQLPLVAPGTYNFVVKWGDGNQNIITAWDQAEKLHTYSAIGTYVIEITGTITGWQPNLCDALKLLNISLWGPLNFGNTGSVFRGCSNLTITATDLLDLSGPQTLYSCFRSCPLITDIPRIGEWNVETVTNMLNMFNATTLSTSNYDSLLVGWGAQNVQNGLSFHGGGSKYTSGGAAEAARTHLINVHGWTITDGGPV
jgi:hypothetical protein